MGNKKISVIVPVYNEQENINKLYSEIKRFFPIDIYDCELILINDGSTDNSGTILDSLNKSDSNVKVINFTRNFGKEMATTAGINSCDSDACIILDADLQHPPKLIPEFLKKWEAGADVVIGVRNTSQGEGIIKKYGSKFFYSIINKITETKMIPNSTDFRLLDQAVILEYNKLTEHNRITRGLIDWLGFDRDYIFFDADKRNGGSASYGLFKLTKLAFNSFVSLSIFPLRLAGYLGILITLFSGALGAIVFVAKYMLVSAWGKSITSSAILAIIIMFLVGIVLICLGLTALYISNIYHEVISRPLYIIKRERTREKEYAKK